MLMAKDKNVKKVDKKKTKENKVKKEKKVYS